MDHVPLEFQEVVVALMLHPNKPKKDNIESDTPCARGSMEDSTQCNLDFSMVELFSHVESCPGFPTHGLLLHAFPHLQIWPILVSPSRVARYIPGMQGQLDLLVVQLQSNVRIVPWIKGLNLMEAHLLLFGFVELVRCLLQVHC